LLRVADFAFAELRNCEIANSPVAIGGAATAGTQPRRRLGEFSINLDMAERKVTIQEYCKSALSKSDSDALRENCVKMGGYEKLLERTHKGLWLGRERYHYLLGIAQDLYQAFPDSRGLKTLLGQMFIIDSKRREIEQLAPEQKRPKQLRILQELDEDQSAFRTQMRRGLNELQIYGKTFTEYYMDFCRLIFRFSGYQPPARLSVAKAAADAAGKTDLWEEFLHTL
jgi:hypothetical protein